VKKKRPKAEKALRADVPRFATTFPADPELDALVDAFQRGDYAAVREGAPRLAERTTDEDVRAAARTLEERISPDPLGKTLILVAAALLLFLAWWYLAHAHGPS
jgi:hypothetical protein